MCTHDQTFSCLACVTLPHTGTVARQAKQASRTEALELGTQVSYKCVSGKVRSCPLGWCFWAGVLIVVLM